MPLIRPAVVAAAASAGVLLTACSGPTGDAVRPPVATAVATASSPAPATTPLTTPATTPPTRSPSAPPTTARPAGTEFTLAATGDVLLHPSLWAQARRDGARTGVGEMDFGPMLAAVRPYVQGADLGLCHLETPLAAAGGPFAGYPDFAGPPQVVSGLRRTGFDACTTASNHAFDGGAAGVDRTLDRLDREGLAHAGSARTEAESRRTTIVEANGVRVALLSYTYGFNGHDYPGGQRWRANVIDPDRIAADARRARSRGAQVVVLALHWGREYDQRPSAQQRRLAPRLARSGAVDVIISHHAHVVEPVQRIGGTWVVYGLGNLLADHATPGDANAEGLLVRFTFTRRDDSPRFAVTRAEYVPLLMTKRAPLRLLDVRSALSTGRTGSSSPARLRAALRRTTRVVTSLGGRRHGLTTAPAPGPGPAPAPPAGRP